jgi:ATP-dependent DNA ligase
VSALRFIQPCSPIRAEEPAAGDGWLHEVKSDGYRVQAHQVGSRVVIYSRSGHDFNERFPSIGQLLHEFPAKAAVLDGEVVASMPMDVRILSGCTWVGPGRAQFSHGCSTCSCSTAVIFVHSRY